MSFLRAGKGGGGKSWTGIVAEANKASKIPLNFTAKTIMWCLINYNNGAKTTVFYYDPALGNKVQWCSNGQIVNDYRDVDVVFDIDNDGVTFIATDYLVYTKDAWVVITG